MQFLSELFSIITARKIAEPTNSYVAKLLHKGTPYIARKLGEESIETILAATTGSKEETVSESADLLFHLLVLWAQLGINPDEVMAELKRREGVSGIAEKASRKE